MKRLFCLVILVLTVVSQAVMAAGPAPCYFQSAWTQCSTASIRVGTNAAIFGAVTNPSTIYTAAGYYADPANSLLASATQTGYTSITLNRVTASSGTAMQVSTNYQDAQTQGSAIVTTNNKAALVITGNGAVAFRGTDTNNSASAGQVGEYVESLVTSPGNLPTSGQYGDATSISLTAGDWDVTLTFEFNKTGATVTEALSGLSTTSGNSATGLQNGINSAQVLAPVDIPLTRFPLPVPSYRFSLPSTTTIYAKMRSVYTAATPSFTTRLSARRTR